MLIPSLLTFVYPERSVTYYVAIQQQTYKSPTDFFSGWFPLDLNFCLAVQWRAGRHFLSTTTIFYLSIYLQDCLLIYFVYLLYYIYGYKNCLSIYLVSIFVSCATINSNFPQISARVGRVVGRSVCHNFLSEHLLGFDIWICIALH